MAPGWARNSGSKGTNSGDHVSALKLAPVSPKRMPSAEDVGAITRAAELRGRGPGGLNFGSAESDVGAHAIVTQLSASMPHLPSRIGMPTASSNSFNELHATTGTPSSTPVATDLSQISAESGSAAASSLLLFPIDFVSATSDSAEQHRQSAGVSANSLTKPRRGSGIFEIRQRLARRLTRNGRQARRHVSSGGGSSPVATAQTITTNASTSFSASMMEASFGSSHSGGSWVRQRKRMFTGNRPGSLATDSQSVDGDTLMRETPCLPMEGSDAADGAQHHALADSTGATDDVADELACGLEKLAISRGGSHSGTMDFDDDVATAECQDSNLPSSRLLSESIDCLLEKRLSSSFDNNPAYGESPTSNNSNLLNDPATTTAKTSTTGSLVSSSASSATLSDPGSQSLTETIEGSESDCAPHATQSGSCKNGLDCSSVNGTNKGIANALGFSSHVLSLGGLQSDLLSTSPDTRVPVQNMQYMPKMSVLINYFVGMP
ncbi:hypothetical protein GGI07_000373 [Coemansia sp. Benny D115]|nr:hypothetical protein GGI07_000373 [Coemansia sp. Benny D115]